MQKSLRALLVVIGCVAVLGISACSQEEEAAVTNAPASAGTETPETFIRAEPEVNATLERPPRSLRIYLNELPNIEKSSLKLFGPHGEVALSRFHTMGANDLMIEIDQHPLPNGEYTVEWMARFGESDEMHTGSYQFSVAVPETTTETEATQ